MIENIVEKEIAASLRLIAKELECDIKNLRKVDLRGASAYNSYGPTKDKVVKQLEFYQPLSVISGKTDHSSGNILIKQTAINKIKFAYIVTWNALTGQPCHRIITNQPRKLIKEFYLLDKLCYEKTKQKPILDEDFIQSILDVSVNFLRKRRTIQQYGVKIKKGLLFSGLPGNGKTMLCRYIKAIASQHNINVSNYSAAILENYWKEGQLDKLMNTEGIVFFDDIDIDYLRKDGPYAKVACDLLSAMDGIVCDGNTVRIISTNESLEKVDKAFLRPGRIDIQFSFDNPSTELRKRFIESWHPDIYNAIKYEIYQLVEDTEDMSFAEINFIKTCLVEEYLRSNQWLLEETFAKVKTRLAEIKEERNALGFAQ